MIKHRSYVWNLGNLDGSETSFDVVRAKCTGGMSRPAPLTSAAFTKTLSSKKFTNGKDDEPLVKQLYADHFTTAFSSVKKLRYDGLGWGDQEALHVAEVLASGAAKSLETLDLSRNKIGDEGAIAIATAVKSIPKLKWLYPNDNQVGARGRSALTAAGHSPTSW